MNTTALIVEVLVIGVFACSWLGWLAVGALGIDTDKVLQLFGTHKDFAPLASVVVLAAFYQVGWMVNSLAGMLFELWPGNSDRNQIFAASQMECEAVRAVVYQNASQQILSDLAVDRSLVRLSRAGSLNFLVLGLCSLVMADAKVLLSSSCLLFALGCFFQYRSRFARYYRRMIMAAREIASSKTHPLPFAHHSSTGKDSVAQEPTPMPSSPDHQ